MIERRLVAVPSTLLLIADIAGYTRFMKMHETSLAHAQQIVASLLEAVIDAAKPTFALAKLEGDAAFLYRRHDASGRCVLDDVATDIYRAFHARSADIQANTLCPCDGCQQAGNLRIKFVGHAGEVAMQRVKRLTELAGVDVIVVHRMLKNAVPIDEYLLVTKPAHALLGAPSQQRATPFGLELDDLGATDAWYVDLHHLASTLPPARRRSRLARLGGFLRFEARNLPYALGLRKACAGFRNLPDGH
jgi:hypothetical protein